MIIPADVLVAIVIAAPEIVSLGCSVAAVVRPIRIDKTEVGRFFRWLDSRVSGRLQQICWLAVDYLMIRGAIWAFQSQPPTTAIAVTAVLTAIAALVGFPFMVPYSCFIALFCERQPLHHDKAKHFPGHTALETAWREIRREFEDVAAYRQLPEMVEVLRDNGLAHFSDATNLDARWHVLFLRLGGRNVQPNIGLFPKLAPLVDRPEVANALFSILPPGVELRSHRGYYKGVLRYHLALIVPEPHRSSLTVGGQSYRWSEGEGVLFDDMYLHSAANHGTAARVVLFLDITRRLPGSLSRMNRIVTRVVALHPYSTLLHRRAAVPR